jgi:hypothetical protein
MLSFRKGRSTVDVAFVLNAAVHKILNENKRLYWGMFDVKRASVYFNGLWLKYLIY